MSYASTKSIAWRGRKKKSTQRSEHVSARAWSKKKAMITRTKRIDEKRDAARAVRESEER